jgi:hypothetical protein
VNSNEQHPIHLRRARAVTRGGAPDAMRRRALDAAVLAIALALAFAALRDAHAATYKWTDEKGVVHYADKMPVDAVNRANVELDSRGVTFKRTEAAPTAEQLRVKATDVDKLRQAAKEKEDQERRDRALIASYTRAEEIDLARNRALATIEGQVQSARVYVAQLTKRQQELLEKKIAAGNKGAPPAVERELESIDRELLKTNEFVAVKKQEGVATAAKYESDKLRWRELTATPEAGGARDKLGAIPITQVGGPSSGVIPTSAIAR